MRVSGMLPSQTWFIIIGSGAASLVTDGHEALTDDLWSTHDEDKLRWMVKHIFSFSMAMGESHCVCSVGGRSI